jgi:hypothetical protein
VRALEEIKRCLPEHFGGRFIAQIYQPELCAAAPPPPPTQPPPPPSPPPLPSGTSS